MDESPDRASTTPARRRRWPILLVIGAMVAAVALRIALPGLVEHGLERVLTNLLAVRVDIEDVHLALQEGVLAIGAELRSQENDALLARIEAIELDLDWEALFDGSLVAERIALVGPELVLAFDEQDRFNWDEVGGPPSPEAEEEAAPEPAGAFRIRIEQFELGAGDLRLIDETAGGLPNLRLLLGASRFTGIEIFRDEAGGEIGWALASADASEWTIGIAPDDGPHVDFALQATAGPVTHQEIPIALSLSREDGVELRVDASIRPAPLEIDATFSWRNLRSRDVLGYLADIGMDVKSGASQGDFELALSFAPGPERGLRLSGSATHESLEIDVRGDEPTSLGVPRIHVELAELFVPIPELPVEPAPPIVVHLKSVVVDDPLLEVTLAGAGEPPKDSGDYLEEGESEPLSEPSRLDLRVDRVALQGGRVHWSDPETGTSRKNSVTLEGRDFRWPVLSFDGVRLRIGGLAPDPIRVDGSGRGENARATLKADRIPLPEWNSLIAHYSDYSVSRGHLSIDATLTIRGDAYDLPIDIKLRSLRAESQGGAFQKTFGMPISMAIPLLSDTTGTIRLKVPVSGSFSQGTQLDLVAVITAALQETVENTLSSTATAPVDLAGSAMRRVGEVFLLGLGEAAFDVGDHSVPIDAKPVLQSAAAFVAGTKTKRIELIPELVEDDFRAFDVDPGDGDVLGTLKSVGRTIFGGKKKTTDSGRARLQPLADRRVAAVERYLVENCDFPRDRIVKTAWDGKVAHGVPRVLLRMKGAKK